MKSFNPDRRKFLKWSTATVGSSLVLGISWAGDSSSTEKPRQLFQPNAWLRIDSTGSVTIFVAESEMGQGPYTSLPMLLAEELEVDWQAVHVEHAPLDPVYGFQGTGGSRSIRRRWKTLREAGAIARQMLLTAGARHLDAPISECHARSSRITHRPSGRSVSYPELITRVANLPIPEAAELKEPDEFSLIGVSIPRVDIPAKLDGSALFGIDIKLPGMLYATIAQSPVFGGKVKGFNAAAIKKHSGVIDCFAMDEGVAVVARSTWQAFQARKAMEIEWHEGEHARLDSDKIAQSLTDDTSLPPASPVFERGNPLSRLRAQPTSLESRYLLPFQAHMTPEPMNCTVQFQAGKIKIWAPTQSPTNAKASAVAALRTLTGETGDTLEQRVEVETPLLGGGFGRRNLQDYVTQAVKIAHRFTQPVQLVWPRDEDVQHDFYHPLTQHRMRGVLDKHGVPFAWHHLITGLQADQYGAEQLPYAIPHVRVEMQRLESPVPIGPWRSVSHHYNAYAIEHFFDELAAVGGRDPLKLRLQLLTQPRVKAILETAAEAAKWHRQDQTRVLGCAVHSSFGSHVAEIVELIREDRQSLKLGKILCVIDCGLAVNPDIIKAQMEGSIVFALTAALKSMITLKNGRVEQSNFHDCPILSFRDTPEIEIIITDNQFDPGGAGEPGVPPLAPALANALLAATGKPVRRLPMSLL